jgi:hypothetical protein
MIAEIWSAVKDIFMGIQNQPSILWYLAPIAVLWFILEIYFGVYKKEKLGWNTALGNGITMMWFCVESMRHLFLNKPAPFWIRFVIVMIILLYAVLIIFFSFSHHLSSKVTYTLASPTPVFYLSAVTALWSHGIIATNKWSFAAVVVVFFVFVLFSALLKLILPGKQILPEITAEPEMPEEPALPEEEPSEKLPDFLKKPL